MKQIKDQIDQEIDEEEILKISFNDIKCVEIAALCHDLGHGPYSHFWERAFDETIPQRKHEDLSVEIFSMLVNSTKSDHDKPIKNEIGLNDEMIDLIERIISGKYDKEKDKNKIFMFEIVANKTSGLDVDKFDYLCRDSIYFGWSNKNKIHDIKRIMHFLRIAKDEVSNNWHLSIRDREIFHVHDIFYYRHLLHRYGYQHKTAKAIECMFKRALKFIIHNENFRNELVESVCGEKLDYDPKIWFSKEFVSKVCDYHIWNIMSKHTNDIVTKIQERKLYKLFCQIHIENEQIQKDILELESKLNNKLGNFIVNFVISSFSLQSENTGNPLLSVKFYGKKNLQKCVKFDEGSLPDLVKLKSVENVFMIFTEKLPEGENEGILNEFKRNLCDDSVESLDESDDLIKEIKNIRNKCKFKERLY